jgi:hypothetical protein
MEEPIIADEEEKELLAKEVALLVGICLCSTTVKSLPSRHLASKASLNGHHHHRVKVIVSYQSHD